MHGVRSMRGRIRSCAGRQRGLRRQRFRGERALCGDLIDVLSWEMLETAWRQSRRSHGAVNDGGGGGDGVRFGLIRKKSVRMGCIC